MSVDTIRAKDIGLHLTENASILIDLRSPETYEKSHIPNAINIPYEDLDYFIDFISQHKQVILYCERGNLSLLAARELSKRCNTHVISIGGGYNAYKQYNRSIIIDNNNLR